MSVVIDDILESVTVELCLNKKYNIIVSCIYVTVNLRNQSFHVMTDMFRH